MISNYIFLTNNTNFCQIFNERYFVQKGSLIGCDWVCYCDWGYLKLTYHFLFHSDSILNAVTIEVWISTKHEFLTFRKHRVRCMFDTHVYFIFSYMLTFKLGKKNCKMLSFVRTINIRFLKSMITFHCRFYIIITCLIIESSHIKLNSLSFDFLARTPVFVRIHISQE